MNAMEQTHAIMVQSKQAAKDETTQKKIRYKKLVKEYKAYRADAPVITDKALQEIAKPVIEEIDKGIRKAAEDGEGRIDTWCITSCCMDAMEAVYKYFRDNSDVTKNERYGNYLYKGMLIDGKVSLTDTICKHYKEQGYKVRVKKDRLFKISPDSLIISWK